MRSPTHSEEIKPGFSNGNDDSLLLSFPGNLGKLRESVLIAHVMPRVIPHLKTIRARGSAVTMSNSLYRVYGNSCVDAIRKTTSEVESDRPIRKLAPHVNNLTNASIVSKIQKLFGTIRLLHWLVKFARLFGHFL